MLTATVRRLLTAAGLLSPLLTSAALAQTAPPLYALTMGVGRVQGPGEAQVGTHATAVNAQGNVYVVGTYTGQLAVGAQLLISRAGSPDVFVTKLDPAGFPLWTVSAGGDEEDMAGGVALDAQGNVYITGQYRPTAYFGATALQAPTATGQPIEDAFVAKLDPQGNWLWATHGGGTGYDYGVALAVDGSGVTTVVGSFSSPTATFGPWQLTNAGNLPNNPSADVFVGRLDANGTWLGAQSLGGTNTDYPTGLTLDATRNAYVCGNFYSPALPVGSTTLANARAGFQDAFVAKLAPTGSWLWAVRAGGRDGDAVQGMALDATGGPVITGTFASDTASFGALRLPISSPVFNSDVFVAALSPAGTWRWANQSAGPGDEQGLSVVADATGSITIGGIFNSLTAQFGPTTLLNTSTAGDTDAFVAQLDAAGTWQWAISSIGTGEEASTSLAVAPDGGLYVAGDYWRRAIFWNQIPNSTTLVGDSLTANVFLSRLDPVGPATIGSFAPASAAPGQVVTLTGSRFVGVQEVRFNGVPATSFRVLSSARLTAIVPSGATAGPITVRTTVGTGTSPAAFQPLVLASAVAQATSVQVWPNPATDAQALRVRLGGAASVSTAELRTGLGQVVRQLQFRGASAELPLRGLAPGVYHLTIRSTGRPDSHQRVIIGQ